MTLSEASRLLKKIDEFVDNLSRPIRGKLASFTTDPLFTFVTPSMLTSLTTALDNEKTGSVSLRSQLYELVALQVS